MVFCYGNTGRMKQAFPGRVTESDGRTEEPLSHQVDLPRPGNSTKRDRNAEWDS